MANRSVTKVGKRRAVPRFARAKRREEALDIELPLNRPELLSLQRLLDIAFTQGRRGLETKGLTTWDKSRLSLVRARVSELLASIPVGPENTEDTGT